MTDRTIDLNGLRLAVHEATGADAAGVPVMLVHGNFASRRWWGEQLRDPPEGVRLVAPSLPNFAGSDARPGLLELDAYADVLLELASALEPPRAVWVGHSLGASVCELLATRAPERVAALLLVDGAPPEGLPRPEEHYTLLDGLRGQREGLDAALRPLCPTRLPGYWEELLDDALAMAPEAYAGHARALGAHRLGPVPDGFTASVTVLRGGLDPLIDDDAARATAAHWPHARLLTWDDVGHAPQLEAPARFRDLLADVARGARAPADRGDAMR